MIVALIVFAVCVWVIGGTAGYCFWWTKDWDLEVGDLVFGIVLSLVLGLGTWFVGWLVHSSHGDTSRVLIRRRA